MSAKASTSTFLNLPPLIRSKIFAHLLSPDSEDDVTTINYTLSWPYLDNPSNTTFAGPAQIDLCACPREDVCNEEGEIEPHIYMRHHCHGPSIHFKSPDRGLWLLQAAHGQFNILRPASATELECRPKVAILRTSKQIYDEALPFLYRGRNFLLLTGPCPRGRYQAYATLQWLQFLSSQAKANVKALSLLVQPYEEDCLIENANDSYAKLVTYLKGCVPGLKWLCLNVWEERFYQTISVFDCLLESENAIVVVRKHYGDFQTKIFERKESLSGHLEETGT